MQQVSSRFTQLASGEVRPVSWAFVAAFDKIFDIDTSFFQLDNSILDGNDVLAPDSTNILAEWDKYVFRDYAKRIVYAEWEREEDVPFSVNLAMADIKLNNYDNFFTYSASAPKAESFVDNFNAGLQTEFWYLWGNANFTGGTLNINSTTSSSYRGLASKYRYDITDSFFSVQVADAGDQTIPSFQILMQLQTIDFENSVSFTIGAGNLQANTFINGSFNNEESTAYDDDVHKFLRIREDSGTLYWEHSVDTTSWTAFADFDIADLGDDFNPASLQVVLQVGTFDDETETSTGSFNNLNADETGARLSGTFASPIGQFMIPRRPIRILSGFDGQNIPQFVGLTTTSPKTDALERTVEVHAEDFLSFIFNKPLDQSVILQNVDTKEALEYLFDLVGLSPDQFQLDDAFNQIKFIYWERGKKLGEAIRELMQAEMGNLYMDENGLVVFRNRLRHLDTPVMSFTAENIVDYRTVDDRNIINVVEVRSEVREVQPTQPVYNLASPLELNTGSNEFFLEFDDPVVNLETITNYIANSQEDGSGSDVTSDVTVSSVDLFTTTVKVTFNNASGSRAFVTDLILYGQPAKVIRSIYLREQDDQSVEKFEEQVLEVENNFLQTNDAATSFALSLINYYKEYGNTIELEVKGSPALQLGDTINVQIDNINDDFIITKIANRINNGQYKQILTAKIFNIPNFFILDESELNGSDVLAP